MKKLLFVAAAALLCLAGCAKPVKVTTEIPADYIGKMHVESVNVTYGEAVKDKVTEDDAKRAEEAKTEPSDKEYVDLPLSEMLAKVLQEDLAEANANGPDAVSVDIMLDTIKFANAAVSILIGDQDQIAGLVTVKDASSGNTVGEFYVDVINSSSGLLGLAIRGGGVREKLASEFADHIVDQIAPKK